VNDPTIPPLVVELVVDAEPDHAFEVWVARTALWWPAGHTVSGDPAAIVFEPRVSGRIFERGPDGAEHDWGEVLAWEPPARLRYLWHLFFDRAEATVVEITFRATDGGTLVRLEQTGWDALGDEGRSRRERTIAGWATVTDRYHHHLTAEETA
jgi:uncharacterized protein YndB with AHSA1/START domain